MSIHEVEGRPSPFVVRWRDNGQNRSMSFATREAAERFQAELVQANQRRERHAQHIVDRADAGTSGTFRIVTADFRATDDDGYVVWTGENGTSSAVHVDFIVGGGPPAGRTVPCLRVGPQEAIALGEALIAVANESPSMRLDRAFEGMGRDEAPDES